MLEVYLFLGFQVDDDLEAKLKKTNSHLVKYFINNSTDEYLHDVQFQEKRFIGKRLSNIVETKKIKLLENNIHSIVSKLTTSYDKKKYPLKVLTIRNDK